MKDSSRAELLIQKYHSWNKPKIDWDMGRIHEEQKERKNNHGNFRLKIILLCFAVGFIAGIAGGIVGRYVRKHEIAVKELSSDRILSLVLLFVLFGIAIFVHIIFHELGHMVCGLLSGYQFLFYRVLSCTFLRTNGKLSVKHHKVEGTGGQCIMTPPKDWNQDTHYLLYNLGGGLMNLLLSVLSAIIMMCCKTSWCYIAAATFTFAGILSAVTNLIPLHLAGLNNDGANIQTMRYNKAAKIAFFKQLESYGAFCQGKKINEFPAQYYELDEDGLETDSLSSPLLQLQYFRCLEEGEFEAAEEKLTYIEDRYDGMSQILKNHIDAERLFMLILMDADERVIVAYYRMNKILLKKHTRDLQMLRVVYAYQMLVLHDSEKAAKTKALAYNSYKYSLVPDEAQLNIDLMTLIDKKDMTNERKMDA